METIRIDKLPCTNKKSCIYCDYYTHSQCEIKEILLKWGDSANDNNQYKEAENSANMVAKKKR